MNDRNTTTSLWSIVETMQSSLEREGMDVEVVDEAVTKKVSSLVGMVGLPWWAFNNPSDPHSGRGHGS